MLVVEDNAMDVVVIRRVLRECGLDAGVRVASDGQQALQYLEQLETHQSRDWPALVLLDLNVPRVPGIEILRSLRTRFRISTRVVIVTSSVSEEDRSATDRLGADAYFQKPNELTAYLGLADVIKRILAG